MADNKVYPNLPFETPHNTYLPGVAQAAQGTVFANPHLNPQPYFSQTELDVANWFTTRVHLSPLGKA